MQPQYLLAYSCVCEQFIYSHGSVCLILLQENMWILSWEYINRLPTHECGNWDWGRAISFLGIHKWDFRYSVDMGEKSTNKLKSVKMLKT